MPNMNHSQFKPKGGFSAKATHAGVFFSAVPGKRRKATDPGAAGLNYLHDKGVVSFEVFASLFPINHLNWDLNRGWVVVAEEPAGQVDVPEGLEHQPEAPVEEPKEEDKAA